MKKDENAHFPPDLKAKVSKMSCFMLKVLKLGWLGNSMRHSPVSHLPETSCHLSGFMWRQIGFQSWSQMGHYAAAQKPQYRQAGVESKETRQKGLVNTMFKYRVYCDAHPNIFQLWRVVTCKKGSELIHESPEIRTRTNWFVLWYLDNMRRIIAGE